MSYTPTALEAAIYQWLDRYISVTLIYENQDAPRPATPFATMLVLGDDRVGRPADMLTTTPSGDDFEEVASSLRAVTCRVTAYGQSAYSVVRTLMAYWVTPDSSVQAGLLGLSVYNVGQATRIPQVLSQVTEDRWVVELQIYAVQELVTAVPALEIIEATVSTTDPS